MFAVVKTGGKQYRVTPGDVIVVEKIIGETGDKVKLDQILMIDEGEKELKIGSPVVEGVAVNCIVLDQSRSDKSHFVTMHKVWDCLSILLNVAAIGTHIFDVNALLTTFEVCMNS